MERQSNRAKKDVGGSAAGKFGTDGNCWELPGLIIACACDTCTLRMLWGPDGLEAMEWGRPRSREEGYGGKFRTTHWGAEDSEVARNGARKAVTRRARM